MERDCMLAHGTAAIVTESLLKQSDLYEMNVCEECGSICSLPKECRVCKRGNINRVELPFPAKLLIQELESMNIKVAVNTKK